MAPHSRYCHDCARNVPRTSPHRHVIVETPWQWCVRGNLTDRLDVCAWCRAPMLLRAGWTRRFCGARCWAAHHALDAERAEAQTELERYWWEWSQERRHTRAYAHWRRAQREAAYAA